MSWRTEADSTAATGGGKLMTVEIMAQLLINYCKLATTINIINFINSTKSKANRVSVRDSKFQTVTVIGEGHIMGVEVC